MHMSLRAVLFTTATVGWVFATLGVLYHDVTARDVGLLVAVGAVGLAVLAGDASLNLPRPQRAPRTPRTQQVSQEAPATAPPADAAPAPRPVGGSADTRAAWSAPTATWDADEAGAAVARPAAVQEPLTIAPVGNGNGSGNGRQAMDVAATAPAAHADAPAAQGTRGLCGKCRTPITVSNRRPLRVTCPVCGHSKVLT